MPAAGRGGLAAAPRCGGPMRATAPVLFRATAVLRHANLYGQGFPVNVGGRKLRGRFGDAIDWTIMAPEWYWERGGYANMGNMPKQWKKDGFGDFLCALTDQEIEMLVYDVLHDILLEENLRDGLDVRAPHPESGEPLYSKIPSWVYQSQGWSRPDIRERVLDRVFKAFRIIPPFSHRQQITHPVELVSWLTARVAHARPRQPNHDVPAPAKEFLDKYPRQPELGFLLALPGRERTALREAFRRLKPDQIDSNYEYSPRPQGEDPGAMRKHMYWLEMDRRRRQEREASEQRADHRERLILERKQRREAAAA